MQGCLSASESAAAGNGDDESMRLEISPSQFSDIVSTSSVLSMTKMGGSLITDSPRSDASKAATVVMAHSPERKVFTFM